MEKDKLSEWLKGQAKQFELTPQQGAFDVMMRKRDQQRKQRNVFVWMSMLAVVTLALSVGIWFQSSQTKSLSIAINKAKHQSLPEQKTQTGVHHTPQPSQAIVTGETRISKEEVTAQTPNENVSDKPMSVNLLMHSPYKNSKSVLSGNKRLKSDARGYSVSPMSTSVDSIIPTAATAQKDTFVIVSIADTTGTTASGDSVHAKEEDALMNAVSLKPSDNQSYWSIMGVFTPQLMNSVYNANSDASLSWMKKYIENREQNDKALYSFNAGIKVEKTWGKHWSLSTGLLYSMVKFEEIKLVNAIVKDSPTIESLALADKAMRIVEVNQNRFDISFSSLEIPLQVGYKMRDKKMYYQVTAGLSYAYLFQTKSLVFDQEDSLNVKETNDANNSRLNKHSILLLGGINIGYQFSQRWSCYAGPVYRYSLNSIYSKDYIIRQQPYYLGLELGVKYSFR